MCCIAACLQPGLETLTAQEVTDVEILLVNGEIHVGDGAAANQGDVAIRDGHIVAVGDLSHVQAEYSIDCSGLIICPGFIDLHNHSDDEIVLPNTRAAMNYVMQGCTTLVTGNCGSGPVDVEDYYQSIDEQGAGTNIAHLLPQGALRRQVMGSDRREASPTELQQMRDLAKKAMQDGAWGMSTGLIYVPSSYADTQELISIAEVVGRNQGIYVSHIRNEGLGLLDAVNEALQIGKEGQLPVHISHFKSSGKDSWGLVRTAIQVIEAARAEGQTVTADQYPYTASSTSLQATVIPAWARAGGQKAMLERMEPEHPESNRILDAVKQKLAVTDNGHRIQIAAFSPKPEWAGRRLDEIANELNISTLELVQQIESMGGASVVNHSINEQDVQYVMQQAWVATASDGSAKVPNHTVPHPRNYGTFPRKIGYYSIQHQVLPLAAAIRSATALPADVLGMTDRGRIKPGLVADIAVFDKRQILDRATFESPHKYSQGIVHLFVNGQRVIANGQATGVLAGKAIRKNAGRP